MPKPLSLTSACGRLRVRFVADDDRFGHVIECQVGDAFAALLRSVEGTADQAWPPSSPLQDVRPCDGTDGRPCLLGTGMAGRSFWSLSVAAAPQALEFDHACRPNPVTTTSAMSTYEPLRPWKRASNQVIEWNDPIVTLRVVPVATATSEPPAIEIVERRLCIRPALRPENSASDRTIRWAFQLERALA